MRRHERLLEKAEKESRRLERLQTLWSTKIADAIKYTFLRSRGFILRRGYSLTLDVLEVVGFALIADGSLTKLVASFAMANYMVHAFSDSALQTIRSDLFIGVRTKRRTLAVLVLILGGIVYGGLFSKSTFEQITLVAFVVIATRIFSTVVNFAIDLKIADVIFQKRVFLPATWNAIGIGLAIVAVACANFSRGLTGVYVLVFSLFAIRLALPLLMYRQCAKSRPQIPNPQTSTAAPSWRRLALSWTPLLAPLSMLAVVEKRTAVILLVVWTTHNLIGTLAERHLRVRYIEFLQFFRANAWDLMESQLRTATLLSFLTAILVYSIAFPFVFWNLLHSTPLCILAWAMLSTLNRILVTRAFSVGVESELARATITIRCAGTVLVLFAGRTSWEIIEGFALVEGLLLCINGWRSHRLRLAPFFALRPNASMKFVSPKHFLTCYQVLSKIFSYQGTESYLLQIKLRHAFRSERKMEAVLSEVSKRLRNGDLIMSLDSRTLLLWAPTVKDPRIIFFRLLNVLPLLIESCELVFPEELPKVLKLEHGSRRERRELPRNRHDFLSFLTAKLRGTWWVPDGRGGWRGTNGEAPPARAYLYHQIVKREVQVARLSSPKRYLLKGSDERHFVFRPFGELLAIYSTKETPANFEQAWSELTGLFLGDVIHRQISFPMELHPVEFASLHYELERMSKSYGVGFGTGECIGWTIDSGGKRRELKARLTPSSLNEEKTVKLSIAA